MGFKLTAEERIAEIGRLLDDPDNVRSVPTEAILAVLVQLSALQIRLAALLAESQVGPTALVQRGADSDPLLTMEQVAERLGVAKAYARELGRRGELPIVRVGRKYVRVRESDLSAWISQRGERGGQRTAGLRRR